MTNGSSAPQFGKLVADRVTDDTTDGSIASQTRQRLADGVADDVTDGRAIAREA